MMDVVYDELDNQFEIEFEKALTDDEVIEKPFPNEHSCRLRNSNDFKKGSFRRGTRKHDSKVYSVIYGRLKGETKLTEQAYRYGKEKWTVSEARSHCKEHEGKFEAASKEKGQSGECVECGELLKEKVLTYEICKFDEEKGIAYGAFLIPLKKDHQGDSFSVEDVEMVAHDFLENSRVIDEMHDKQEHDAAIVESVIAPYDDFDYHGKSFSLGSWVGAIKFYEEEIKKKIKNGTYKGFSVQIAVQRI